MWKLRYNLKTKEIEFMNKKKVTTDNMVEKEEVPTFKEIRQTLKEIIESQKIEKEQWEKRMELREREEMELRKKERMQREKEKKEEMELRKKERMQREKEKKEEMELRKKERMQREKEKREEMELRKKERMQREKEKKEEMELRKKEKKEQEDRWEKDRKKTENIIHKVFAAMDIRDKRMEERDRKTDKRFNKIRGEWGNDWGEFTETLVSGSLTKIFKARDITIDHILKNQTYHSKDIVHRWEFDIIAINGKQIFIFEVKKTMDISKVEHFIKQLESFLKIKDEFSNREVYAGVAYLDAVDEKKLLKYAENRGLLVLRAAGNSADLVSAFKPKAFYKP